MSHPEGFENWSAKEQVEHLVKKAKFLMYAAKDLWSDDNPSLPKRREHWGNAGELFVALEDHLKLNYGEKK